MKHVLRRSMVTTISSVLAAASMPLLAADAEGDLTTPAQRTGYSMGISQTAGKVEQLREALATYGLEANVDLDAFIAGMRDGIAGEQQMSDDDINSALTEFNAMAEAKVQSMQAEQTAAFEQEAAAQAQASASFLEENASKPGVMTTDSGLQYSAITEAADAGAAMPGAADVVTVHYTGTLLDGTVFDSSVERGEPYTTPLNQVIEGWTEGVQLMNVGDKYKFFIPADLAYGPQGRPGIPPNALLIFEIELLGVEAAQ